MKVITCCWTGEKETVSKLPSWFQHVTDHTKIEVIDVSWEQIKELYETGLHVMLYHVKDSPDDYEMILYVDHKRFYQR